MSRTPETGFQRTGALIGDRLGALPPWLQELKDPI
jgi:hypothetical protein